MASDTPTCDWFDAHLSPFIASDLNEPETRRFVEHRERCSRCAAELTVARDVDRLVATWTTPSVPPGLTSFLVDALTGVHDCDRVRADLSPFIEGDLEPADSDQVEKHLAACEGCQREVVAARSCATDLQTWEVPAPPHDLTARILAAAGDIDEPAPTADQPQAREEDWTGPQRQRPRLRVATRWMPWIGSAAAAVLFVAALQRSTTSTDAPLESTPRPAPMSVALRQLQIQRELRLTSVALEQMPSGIGSFDAQPSVVGNSRRPTGNAFHLALRDAKTNASLQVPQSTSTSVGGFHGGR